MKFKTWGEKKRPWGWEVRVDVDANGKIFNEVLNFKDEKEAKEKLSDKLKELEAKIEQRIITEALPPEPTKDEIIETLKAEISSLKETAFKVK